MASPPTTCLWARWDSGPSPESCSGLSGLNEILRVLQSTELLPWPPTTSTAPPRHARVPGDGGWLRLHPLSGGGVPVLCLVWGPSHQGGDTGLVSR